MSLVERHKKPGGFKKLVQSLELTPHDRRGKIIEAMRREDPEFIAEVEKCIFEFEEFKNIPDMVITDIVYTLRNDMRSLAVALYKCKDPELYEKFSKNMLTAQGALFKDEIKMLEAITVGVQKGARFKVIAKARELQDAGVIALKKYSSIYPDI
jgi:flagellar motor switch protein FliG